MFKKTNSLKIYSPKNVVLFRIFDIIFSSIGLVILIPILIILYIIGKFDTGFPLFKQKRIGRYEKSFVLIELIEGERNSPIFKSWAIIVENVKERRNIKNTFFIVVKNLIL